MRSSTYLALLGLATRVATTGDRRSVCSGFNLTNVTNVEFTDRPTYYAANAHVKASNAYSSIDVSNLPAFCRVELTITTNTATNSTALTEVWLPDNWNGRVLTVGNGGFAGGVTVAELGYVAVPQGFAGISTNNGHNSAINDGSWIGPNNVDAIVDWGWRAMHLSVIVGKEVVKQYYSTSANKSYYLGCSNGGRQGLKEVQEFPEDFDGVVVGSPANWWTHLHAWTMHMNLNTQPSTSPHFMVEDTWKNVIAPEVMRQCDALDGLTDGIINDPRNCHFRPETLTCLPGQNTSTCLTPDQISALHRIYADYYEADQTYVFGGYYPGGESGYFDGLVGETQFRVGRAFFQYMITNNTDWKVHDYDAHMLTLADEIDPGQANAISPDITGFVGPQHNGKVIHYVGWADQLISPGNSLYYYESVHQWTRANTRMDIDNFYRLFTVPGMRHCHGGLAANGFGGVQQASNNIPPLSLDAQHNVLAAIVQWVERDVAPDNFTAVYYKDNNVAKGVGFTRPLCRYPYMLKYAGGDHNSANSFECVWDL